MGIFNLLKGASNAAFGLGQTVFNVGIGAAKGAKVAGKGALLVGPPAVRTSLGVSPMFGARTILAGAGVFGIAAAGRGLVSGGYNMDSALVNWGGDPTTSAPYEAEPMQFGAYRRSYLDQNATGSLAFSLHNMR